MIETKENSRWNKTNRKKRKKEVVKRVEKSTIKITHGEKNTYEQFFRGEHPDTRSNTEFLKSIGVKIAEKRRIGMKWYPLKRGNRSKAVICINTKKEYPSIEDAAIEVNVPLTRMWRHINGYHEEVAGMRFKYI